LCGLLLRVSYRLLSRQQRAKYEAKRGSTQPADHGDSSFKVIFVWPERSYDP
jgi:hypothetical protein